MTDNITVRIMIVDRSEVARSIMSHILQKEMHNAYIVTCGSAEEAMEYLHREKFDLVTTALLLPGLDGLDLCHNIRKSTKQRLTPVIVVSSDADKRLLSEGFSAGVTDYFNKSLGYRKLVEFIKDVAQRHAGLVGRILYVEDSITTAVKIQALMQNHGLHITHMTTAERALELLKEAAPGSGKENEGYDVIFTDFFLEGPMTGGDLLYAVRTQLHFSRQELPVLVVTVQDNEDCQADIFHAGANDFITKPVIEEVLIARIKSLLLVKHQYNVLKRYSRDMYQLATTDGLTGVHNKQYLLNDAPDFLKKHPKSCVMMVDIDHIESINDRHGHLAGDHVLHVAGHFLNEHFEQNSAFVARFGGKKFTIILPDCDMEQAAKTAENLRVKIMELRPDGIDITVSIGISSADGSVKKPNLDMLLADADSGLNSAKAAGFNCVFFYTPA
ncbi:MAG: response regulator [Gammaproteobacteria bacterium]|nr:response regulator [Gammaproteobacteria bacterium]